MNRMRSNSSPQPSPQPSPLVQPKRQGRPRATRPGPIQVPLLSLSSPADHSPRPAAAASPEHSPVMSLTLASPESPTPPPQPVHVRWSPDGGPARLDAGSTRPGALSVTGALEAQLNRLLTRVEATGPDALQLCLAADAMCAGLFAFQLSGASAQALIANERLWWQLSGAGADSLTLAEVDPTGAGASRWACQRQPGPVAAFVAALVAQDDLALAAEALQACSEPRFRWRVVQALRQDIDRPLDRLQGLIGLTAADDTLVPPPARRSGSRSQRHTPRPLRDRSHSPQHSPTQRRASQNLNDLLSASRQAEAALTGLCARVGDACEAHGWAIQYADNRFELVALNPGARFPLALFTALVDALEVERGQEPLYLGLVHKMLALLSQDLSLAPRPCPAAMLDALDRLRALCTQAYADALQRHDKRRLHDALQALEALYGLSGGAWGELRQHQATVVGRALQSAVQRGEHDYAVALMQTLAPIAAPATLAHLLIQAAQRLQWPAQALSLLGCLSRFMLSPACTLPAEGREPFTHAVLQGLPDALKHMLRPTLRPGGTLALDEPVGATRLARWMVLAGALVHGFEWRSQPALITHWRRQNGQDAAFRWLIDQLPPDPHGPDDIPGLLLSADALARALREQMQVLPTEIQQHLLFAALGVQGLGLYPDARLCTGDWGDLLFLAHRKSLTLLLLHWHAQQHTLVADDDLAHGALLLVQSLDDPAALVRVLTLDRTIAPTLFQRLIAALAEHDRLAREAAPDAPQAWPAAFGALLAGLLPVLIPGFAGPLLVDLFDDYLARDQRAGALLPSLNPLLGFLWPLLPLLGPRASAAVVSRLQLGRLHTHQLIALFDGLRFDTVGHFDTWCKAISASSPANAAGLITLLSAWLRAQAQAPHADPDWLETVSQTLLALRARRKAQG